MPAADGELFTPPPLLPCVPIRRDDAGCDSRVAGHHCSENCASPGKILPLAPRPDSRPEVRPPGSTLKVKRLLAPPEELGALYRPGSEGMAAHYWQQPGLGA